MRACGLSSVTGVNTHRGTHEGALIPVRYVDQAAEQGGCGSLIPVRYVDQAAEQGGCDSLVVLFSFDGFDGFVFCYPLISKLCENHCVRAGLACL